MANNQLALFGAFARQSKKKKAAPKPSKVVVAFPRISSKKQEEGVSLDVQRQGITAFCAKEGMPVDQWFGCTYESAKDTSGKEFNRMLAYVRQNHKRIYAIVVYTLDRFSRTGETAITLINELKDKYQVRVLSATEPNTESIDDPDYNAERELLASKHENQKRAKKIRGGMEDLTKAGYWVHNTPLGYTNQRPGRNAAKHQLVINETGELLRQAFEMKASGLFTDVQISQKLHTLGVKINARRLGDIFRNPFYCGLVSSSVLPGQVFKGKHPALISEELFLYIHGVYEQTKGGRNGRREKQAADVPLKGFMRSAISGRGLTGYKSKENGKYYYKSPEKGDQLSQRAETLHTLFTEQLKGYQLDAHYIPYIKEALTAVFEEERRQTAVVEINILKQNRAAVEKRLQAVRERFAIGEIDRDMYTEFSQKFQQELGEIEKELGKLEGLDSSKFEKALEKLIALSCNLYEYWQSGDYAEKQRLQYLVFPDGMTYDKKNGVVLSPKVNSIFAAIPVITGGSGCKEGKETGGRKEKSAQVMLSAVEG